MKKLFIFALLILPMTTFAASSVRVLGAGSNLPGAGTTTKTTTTAAKATPSKAAMPKAATTAAKAGDATTSSRIGTVRTKAVKATPGTTANATAATGSRFPVITPAHSYNTVVNPQAGTGAKPGAQANVDLSNYYNKQEVDDLLDDPRFDMIRKATSAADMRAQWVREVGETEVRRREDDGYVFMWIEE